MNAPTGRKRRVSVSDSAIAASDLPKSFPIAVSVITTRKKSNASSVQPRKPAATVAFRSLAARGAVNGLRAQQAVDSAADVAQIRLAAAIQLGDDAAAVADVGEGLAHGGPVDVAIAEVYPGVTALFALEVFEVDLDDAFAQRANPILGVPVEHDIADIKPRLHPGAVKLAEVLDHFERAEQELVPYFFDGDDDLHLLGERHKLANLCL